VWCERVPTMTARSPRAREFAVCHAFIVKLVIIGAGMALAGMVAVCATVLSIVASVLAAYATPGRTPVWRGALLGGAIGLGLGGLAGIPERDWLTMVPAGGVIGLLCGAATSRAGR